MRTDIAGYSHEVIGGLDDRNLHFSIGMPANERWQRDARSTACGTTTGRPRSTRTAVPAPCAGRRARGRAFEDAARHPGDRASAAHPGAQLKLSDHNGWRHQVIVTNQTGHPALLEPATAPRPDGEPHQAAQDIGEARFRFTRFV
ncbi:MAG TPA: hypothetical protein VHF25_14470 [Nitriliruptorales bacterium]|nr:hypothetical protein [Nitriliruptorales bacterium]